MRKVLEIWRLPQDRYVDAVRWLPSASPFKSRLLALGLWDSDRKQTVMEVSSLQQESASSVPSQSVQLAFTLPARITALRTAILPSDHSILVASSRAGDISVIIVGDLDLSSQPSSTAPVVCPNLHKGEVSGLDFQDSQDCVTVGEDGKINLVQVAQSRLQSKCIYDNGGLMSFSAVSWASHVEFVTGSVGSTVQWWDHRRPGGSVSQSPQKWATGTGGIHSIDVHPSRKHLCVVGGSGGSVFAWDLRSEQEPIPLSGCKATKGRDALVGQIVESEVWEVKYDPLLPTGRQGMDTGKMPPVMMCSEDGILAVLDGGDTTELHVDGNAINTFHIDPENCNNVVCGLENESILYLRRAS